MAGQIIVAPSSHRRFTLVSNAAARDARLNLKAKGLLLYLLSHDPNIKLTESFIIGGSKDGRHSTRGAMNQLEEFGYMVRRQARTRDGEFSSTIYIVTDDPATLTEEHLERIMCGQFSVDRKPVDGLSDDGESTTKKTSKKEDQEKEHSFKEDEGPVHTDDISAELTRSKPEAGGKLTLPELDLSHLDGRPGIPDRHGREALPLGERHDPDMFSYAWHDATRHKWSRSRNGDLLVYITRYWSAAELGEVLETLERRRRDISSPISYMVSMLSGIAEQGDNRALGALGISDSTETSRKELERRKVAEAEAEAEADETTASDLRELIAEAKARGDMRSAQMYEQLLLELEDEEGDR